MAQRIIFAITLSLALVALTACPQRDKHPADPGMQNDDLGIGISLGMDVSAARDKSPAGVTVWVITKEELGQRNPYAESSSGDVVIALYTAAPADVAAFAPGISYNTVTELRCYLGPPDNTRIKLQGKLAFELTPEKVTAMLGEPAGRTTDSNGATHLVYRFAPPDDAGASGASGYGAELVSSHGADGACFALSLKLKDPGASF
jgi:hypothetical protein